MSFETAARLVVETSESDLPRNPAPGLTAQEELFFRGLRAQGYTAGLNWLEEKAAHVGHCGEAHTKAIPAESVLARDLLKLVSYGYLKGLMERRFNIALAYPEINSVMFAPAGTVLEIPVASAQVAEALKANPLAKKHLMAMAEEAKATNGTVIRAVAPSTKLARQLLNLLAGESLRRAVQAWLTVRYGFGFDVDWYGCCAPAIASRGKLRLTLEEQVKYQTMPAVMC